MLLLPTMSANPKAFPAAAAAAALPCRAATRCSCLHLLRLAVCCCCHCCSSVLVLLYEVELDTHELFMRGAQLCCLLRRQLQQCNHPLPAAETSTEGQQKRDDASCQM
jgi:hypothetical protein